MDLNLTMLISAGHRALPRSLASVRTNCSTHGFDYRRNVLYVSVAFVGGCMMF